MLDSLTFLTPRAGLLALAALAPLTALVITTARVKRARTVLRLPEPRPGARRRRSVAIVSVPLLIALALAQPAWRRHGSVATRADAGIFVVVDTSNSMAAAASTQAPSRLEQAKRIALSVGSQLPGIPLGVATFTDRTLPSAFPTADAAVFNSTIRSLAIDSPPPRETSRVATDFSALAAIQRADFFSPAQRHRALVLLTDGESTTFDAGAVARALAAAPRTRVVIVRVGGERDRLHGADGRAGGSYRADPERARRAVSQLTTATGGRSFTGSGSGVAAALRAGIGPGATTEVPSAPETRTLAPIVALISLVFVAYTLTSSEAILRPKRRFP
jgi:hypothetical protein